MPTTKLLSALCALGMAATLAACPDLPRTAPVEPDADASLGDADAFVPLILERIVDSVGQPEGGERVTIYGQGLTPGATVNFGDAPGNGMLTLDEGTLNVNVPSHEPGLVDVSVTLPDGQVAILENAYLFAGPLELTAIEPTVDSVRGGAEVTVTGEGFDDKVKILVAGRMLEDQQRVDANTIKGIVPARLQGEDGFVDVVASNGFEQRTLRRAFRYIDPLGVTWLSPPGGPASGGTVVTLYGSGLTKETRVSFGGIPAETVLPGRGGTLTVRTPPSLDPDGGAVDIVLVNPLESRALSSAFYYVGRDETVDGIKLVSAWPPRGNSQGGTQLALSVLGLPDNAPAKGLGVTIGGESAEVIEVRAWQNLVVVAVPPGSPGQATVVVNRSGSSSSRDDLFTYREGLVIDQAIPRSGRVEGGEEVTILGEGFTSETRVLFGGTEAPSVKLDHSGQLRVQTPASVAGTVDLRVADSEQGVHLRAGFEFVTGDTPKLLAVSPPDGAQSGGRIIRLHGSGFSDVNPAVFFGEGKGDEVRVIDDATIHMRAPRGEVGAVNVRTSQFGMLAMAYEYFDPTALYMGTYGGTIPEATNVTVIDLVTREPIEEAFVISWDDTDTPFQGVTDDRGQITLSAPGFGPPQMITAAKDNYTTASIVEFDSRNATLSLIPLVQSPPNPGGGGPGPQPLPDGTVAGNVSGLDKYILPPPGNCDSKSTSAQPGELCAPCLTDNDCLGPGARCTMVGDQGGRCTTACETDAQCPSGYNCVGVGFGDVQCLPAPGKRQAWCGTTATGIFDDAVIDQPGAYTDTENQLYQFNTAPGEHAIVCLGGWTDPDTGEFIPTMMGVRRHVFAMAGDLVGQQDVKLDIPLTRTLKIRLDDAPVGPGEANVHEVDVFIDLGSDGVFHMPTRGTGVDQNYFELPNFPVKFEESLYDASYTILAGAYTPETIEGTSNTALNVLLQDITQLEQDTVFEIFPEGAKLTKTGIVSEVHGMHGWGNERIWAAGDDGQVLVFDGTWWALQQVPTTSTLRDIWAANNDYVWTAGDNGAVFRWDGFEWNKISMPRSLSGANWWALHGVGADVWLVGDKGVFRHNGKVVEPIITQEGKRAVTYRDVWAETPDTVYLVGDGGAIRRWTPAGIEKLDRAGGDFFAIDGSRADDIWVVGERGRISHWNGNFWFDFLPVTRRHLRAVHATDSNKVWAAGDAGAVLKWDGEAWEVAAEVEHSDLSGVHLTDAGRVMTGGRHVVIAEPFLRVPNSVNPSRSGQLQGLTLEWQVPGGADGSFTYAQLLEQNGFPFWDLMVKGGRHEVPLPDLEQAWGLQALWPGPGAMRLIRVYMPDFTIDNYDRTMLNQLEWQAWTTVDLPLVIQEEGSLFE